MNPDKEEENPEKGKGSLQLRTYDQSSDDEENSEDKAQEGYDAAEDAYELDGKERKTCHEIKVEAEQAKYAVF